MIAYLVFIFIMGLLAGSFANVCIHRMPKDLSVVKPRSYCPHCRNTVSWYDNIPVISFIILAGKCRHCKEKISFQYPLVELMTGVLFLIVGWHFAGDPLRAAVYLVFTLILIIISAIDYIHQIIPDILSIFLLLVGLSFSFINGDLGLFWKTRLINSLLGGFVSASLLFAIGYLGTMVFKKDAMGGGDVKLILGIGALIGLKKALIVIFLASLLGSVIGILLILIGKNKREEYIPFGPFISFAAYISLFIPHYWMFW